MRKEEVKLYHRECKYIYICMYVYIYDTTYSYYIIIDFIYI